MSATDHKALIERFYAAFAALDGDTMQACYADDAVFEDPVFSLRGRTEIGGMWRMLCDTVRAKGQDVWKLQASAIHADGQNGSAHWEPHYRFSATGRMVHNVVDAQFRFHDGLIVDHRDHFSFWRWSRQALGPAGAALGWTPQLRSKVRTQAAANLRGWLERDRAASR